MFSIEEPKNYSSIVCFISLCLIVLLMISAKNGFQGRKKVMVSQPHVDYTELAVFLNHASQPKTATASYVNENHGPGGLLLANN